MHSRGTFSVLSLVLVSSFCSHSAPKRWDLWQPPSALCWLVCRLAICVGMNVSFESVFSTAALLVSTRNLRVFPAVVLLPLLPRSRLQSALLKYSIYAFRSALHLRKSCLRLGASCKAYLELKYQSDAQPKPVPLLCPNSLPMFMEKKIVLLLQLQYHISLVVFSLQLMWDAVTPRE